MNKMKILIFGAGVIGSLYGALLAEAGHEVSLYARGARLKSLQENGLRYRKNAQIFADSLFFFGKNEIGEEIIPDFGIRNLHRKTAPFVVW